jgi:hypothetical protein
MKLVTRLIVLAALAGLGYWGWTVLFPSPAKIIEGRLIKIAKLASFTSAEGHLTALANTERLGPYFSDDVQVVVNIPGVEAINFNNRGELMQAALAARSSGVNSLSIRFIGIVIDVSPDKQSATADVTLDATSGSQKDSFDQELKITFQHVGRDWLITRAETVRVLR